jgi:nitrous oxide reductase accessory protein NosL
MKKSKNWFTFLFVLMLTLSFLFVSQAQAQQWCDLCAMDLHKYRLTKYILTLENKTQKHTCSLHCAAIVINNNNVIQIDVSDYETGDMIDTKDSYYVVQSDIKGVMSQTSKLAFANKAQAEKFIAHHGGSMTTFDGALKLANADMEQDMLMLKNNISDLIMLGQIVAKTNCCFACHGEDGHGGIKKSGSDKNYFPAWNTKMFAVKMNTKAKIKKVIITGQDGIKTTEKQNDNKSHMPAWEDAIKGKELHALTNYIWSLRDVEGLEQN